jgi:hypothetical protein
MTTAKSNQGQAVAAAANMRWEAEASLNKAHRDAFAALNMWYKIYQAEGKSDDEARRLSVEHLPNRLLNLIGVDRYDV